MARREGHRDDTLPRRSTLLALVQQLQRFGFEEDEVVATALRLVREGRVVLTGSFAGAPLRP